MEGHVGDAPSHRRGQVVARGEAAIGRRLPRRLPIDGDVALQHRQQAVTVGRVACFDHQIEEQAAPAGGQVEFVAVLGVAAAFDDESACGSKRLTNFSPAGTGSPANTRRSLCLMMRSIIGR